MRFLISGANGFVGQALCKALAHHGEYIVALVRNSNTAIMANKVIVNHLDSNADFTDALQNTNVIIHLAARTHVLNDESADSYQAYATINIDATRNLATQAIAAGVKRFIFLSSVKVNGEQTAKQPYLETDIPKPEDDYGRTKYEAEEMLKVLTKSSNMELVIIRPPLIYGKGVKANFKRLIKLCKSALPLPFGAINNKRSMIYIENLIDFIVLCTNHPNVANQTFLVSDDEDVSTTELIKCICEAFGKKIFLLPIPKLFYQVLCLIGKESLAMRLYGNLQVDISKAKTLLGWKPPYSFKQGIRKTIQ